MSKFRISVALISYITIFLPFITSIYQKLLKVDWVKKKRNYTVGLILNAVA